MSAFVSPALQFLPINKAKLLFNATCVYCGQAFDKDHPWTKEHIIGRRFVPRGALDGEWNLLVRACQPCNNGKADLENDLSALTMQPDVFGRYPCDDPAFIAEAKRRAEGAHSRRTRRKVKDSAEQFMVSVPFLVPGSTATFTFNSAPQTDCERVSQLAAAHVQGFFYFLTYEQGVHAGLRRGGFMPGVFRPVMDAKRADWGNDRLRSFADVTATWDYRFHLIGAHGFFKAVIRRPSSGAEVWSWGLEWNESHRVVGFFGDPREVDKMARTLAEVGMETVGDLTGHHMRFRQEVSLPEEEDELFRAPEPR